MNEKPILFSGPMVRAILDGRKTMTRRVMKIQPPSEKYQLSRVLSTTGPKQNEGKLHWLSADVNTVRDNNYFTCPYGKVGDRLWVRENFALTGDNGSSVVHPIHGGVAWQATEHKKAFKWKPSIHMPRWASRITLEITGIRVERLQCISEEDAIAEGCYRMYNGMYAGEPHRIKGTPTCCTSPEIAYQRLWESINGPESWAANPWVWVVEFRRVEQ